jgi:hypothetical protein
MKKRQRKNEYRVDFGSRKYGSHFDWLLLAFISFVIILLVFAISI